MSLIEWKHQIDLAHLHHLFEDGKISLSNLGKAAASYLRHSHYYSQSCPEFCEIVGEFEDLDDVSDIHDYNTALDLLYDFGDDGNKLWVETEQSGRVNIAQNKCKPSMSDTDFDIILEKNGIDKHCLNNRLYNYIRGSLPEYQNRLLERWKLLKTRAGAH